MRRIRQTTRPARRPCARLRSPANSLPRGHTHEAHQTPRARGLLALAAPPPAAAQVKLNGAGATFPNIIYQDWMLTYGRIARTVERSDHPTIRLSDTYHRRARLLLLVRCRAGAVRPDAHHSAAGRDLLDRALRVRQEHVPPVHQPHERALARNAPRRRHPARRNVGVLPRDRSR